WSGPILAGDRLILAGSHGAVLSVSPYTGRILGTEDMPDGIPVAPVAANGSVYFLSNDAELLAYR
ncbi:MAG: pyrrolo-quinoline quinone, partial [Rhodospirillales bacterium]